MDFSGENFKLVWKSDEGNSYTFNRIVSDKSSSPRRKKIELSVGSKLLFPISDEWDGNYLVGVSTGLGFVLSHQTILSGSIAYLPYISNEDSPENWTSLPGLTVDIKRVFPSRDSSFNAYLQLEAGLFIPIADGYIYFTFPGTVWKCWD